MGLSDELGLKRPFTSLENETLMNIIITGSMLTKEGRRLLRPYGITEAQYNVLMLLKDQADDGRVTQTRLGDMLVVNRANITGLIDRMETAGLVRRVADPEDRRVNLVEMTDEGRAMLKKAEKAYYSRIAELLGGLNETDMHELSARLTSIRERI